MTTKLILISFCVAILAACEQYDKCSRIDGYIGEVCKPEAMLSLDSFGGRMSVAAEISRMVEYTHVDGDCLSACVMISSRGYKRSACHDSWFGFHQANTKQATAALLDFFYQDDRIDYEYIKGLIERTEFGMSNISADSAMKHGIIDEVVLCE